MEDKANTLPFERRRGMDIRFNTTLTAVRVDALSKLLGIAVFRCQRLDFLIS